MSKENKMTYNGKKCVTKISDNSCEGCVFADFTIPHVCTLKKNNTKCSKMDNRDNQHRIWVKDTSATKEEKKMSKENKMVHEGKKYVTKKSHHGSCSGCVFKIEDTYGCNFYKVMDQGTRNKCLPVYYKDGDSRIWVEDKSIDKKPKKRHKYVKKYETRIIDGFPCFFSLEQNENDHVWVIEYHNGEKWIFWGAESSRSIARRYVKDMVSSKTRIRKFIVAK